MEIVEPAIGIGDPTGAASCGSASSIGLVMVGEVMTAGGMGRVFMAKVKPLPNLRTFACVG